MSTPSSTARRAPQPRATYRLQLRPDWPLEAVCAHVPYLAALGVSHLYLSPIWPAVAGSEHGYDVVAHDGVRDELGRGQALERAAALAHEHGMGILVDLVPSHVAATLATPLWRELLASGHQGPAADAFDVDWEAGQGRVLLPILEQPLEQALELFEPAWEATGAAGAPPRLIVRSPIGDLPASAASAATLGGTPPAELARDPERLRAFLEQQHWRPIDWREPRRNVRRFFDIDDLVALRSDRRSVFDATHAALSRWIAHGWVDGVRIDHVDGLQDPARYLRHLRSVAPQSWILVEKILAPDESLPSDWAADGTTGYELARAATAVLVDEAGFAALQATFRSFTGDERPWDAIVREARAEVLGRLFPAEFERCARALERAAAASTALDSAALRDALHAYLIELDVYRTYRTQILANGSDPGSGPGSGPGPDADRRRIRAALERARGAHPDREPALAVLGALLTSERPDPELIARVETLSPALTAKAVEDTALYRYHPLAALCEVGAEPNAEALGTAAFHAAMGAAAQRPSAGLFALSTHDSKRSADVRARLALLSERPALWAETLERWSRAAEPHRTAGLPERRIESLVWQTLVGAWPLSAERAVAYFEKAAREAKLRTNWRSPRDTYEEALEGFVRGVLADEALSGDVGRFAAELDEPAWRNALAQVLVAATAAGVPDIYQGDELWNAVLVDPDNRGAVDFALRERLLAEVTALTPESAWGRRAEGLAKLFLWQRTLALRAQRPDAFAPGAGYVPLAVEGPEARRVIAYQRGAADRSRVVCIVPRLMWSAPADWRATTFVELPEGRWRNALDRSDAHFEAGHAAERLDGRRVALAALTARFPVGLWASEDRA